MAAEYKETLIKEYYSSLDTANKKLDILKKEFEQIEKRKDWFKYVNFTEITTNQDGFETRRINLYYSQAFDILTTSRSTASELDESYISWLLIIKGYNKLEEPFIHSKSDEYITSETYFLKLMPFYDIKRILKEIDDRIDKAIFEKTKADYIEWYGTKENTK